MDTFEITQIRIGDKLYNLIPVNEITPASNKPAVRHYHRRAKPNGYEFSKTYSMYLSPDDFLKVRQAIQHVEVNYTPTTRNIMQQTGFHERKTQAILKMMREKGVIKSRKNKKQALIHQLVEE